MTDEALFLMTTGASSKNNNIAKMLSFFGVQWRTLSTEQFLAQNSADDGSSSKSRLICSSDVFLKLIEDLAHIPDGMKAWGSRVHSAFVYPGDDSGVLQDLARILTGDDAVIHQRDSSAGNVTLSDRLDDFCGVMAGLRITPSGSDADTKLVLSSSKGNAINIISTGSGALFLKSNYQQVPVFFSIARKIIDIGEEVAAINFDIRERFLAAVPIVLYVKWAFAQTCWRAPEANACLVIDDPLLRPTYGCLNFQELLGLMERHRFSTNIAFIPWNWRRSAPEVARLFRESSDNYSISIHGCDHTRAEFGSPDLQHLYWKTQRALERMDQHELNTGICHNRVMVFPQGVFSKAAVSVLKHTNLIAAVNNDTISADLHPRAMTISELWDIAVMSYDNFPIFTRRDPAEGIENFAFDILLGKPAVIGIHHDYCSDHCSRLVNFIDKLNALNCPLKWRDLTEVVRRSYRQREILPDVVEVEMYGMELQIENRSAQRKRFSIRRRECEPSGIREIHDGSGPIAWNIVNGHIYFETELGSGQSKTLSVRFHELAADGKSSENVSYRLKAMLRRYLSELRDNYVVKNNLRLPTLLGNLAKSEEVRCKQQ